MTLSERWRSLVDHFIHPSLRESDADTVRRSRLTATFALTMMGVAAAYSIAGLVQQTAGTAVWVPALIGYYCIVLFVLKKTGSQADAANILLTGFFCAVLGGALTGGGPDAPGLPWFAAFSLLAVLLRGTRTGWAWTGLATASVIAMSIADRAGVDWPVPELDAETLAGVKMTTFIGSVIATCLLAGLFESAKDRMLRAVQAATRAAEEAHRIAEQERQNAQRVLDSVNQGLLMADLSGRLLPGRSQAVEAWFGKPDPDSTLAAYLGRSAPALADWLTLGWGRSRRTSCR